jgi:predicted neuraminidase
MSRQKYNSLKTTAIHQIIIDKLGNGAKLLSDPLKKPLILETTGAKSHKFRIYSFNCNNPPGGRPDNEYKIVLNVGQDKGQRGNFDNSDGCIAIVLGYVFDYDVFVLWDTRKHINFAFNKNLQVKGDTVLSALANRMSFQERKTKQGLETIVAVRSSFLYEGLLKRVEILIHELTTRL